MSRKALSLIALRVLSSECTGKKRLIPMKFYYFQKGISLEREEYIQVSSNYLKEMKYGSIYDEYLSAEGGDHPSVSITAIVGKNGSGKSSIVEMTMRLINNFATSMFGENPPTNKAVERLRFIDGVQAELYYQLDDYFYRLRVLYRNVRIDQYEVDATTNDTYVLYSNLYYDNEQPDIPQEEYSKVQAFPSRNLRLKEHIEKLSGFFYTLVHNYSIHAYNTNDFKNECCTIEYERSAQGRKTGYTSPDDRCWLRGLFHKNDGYQRPIVIAPYRNQGSIDIGSEKTLLRDRFIGLLLSTTSFRQINGHLVVTGIKVKRNEKVYGLEYLKGRSSSQYTQYYYMLDKRGYEKLKKSIINSWSAVIKVDLNQFKDSRRYYFVAIDYLVCKTLKVAAQYNQFNSFYLKHQKVKSKIDETAVENLVRSLFIDHSHITKKIRQTLAYLVFGTYEDDEWNIIGDDVDKAQVTAMRLLADKKEARIFLDETDEIVPPPIFDSTIHLKDTITGESIEFDSLSSGEKQQIFTISSILYHLQNLQSVFRDDNKQRATYSHACVVLEEIELYYHPELQQEFLQYLLDGIRQVKLPGIQALYFLVVTHSPFVLSDLPTDKILALEVEDDKSEMVRSFAANIHEILKTGFFLKDGSIGLVAQWLLSKLAICLKLHKMYINRSNEIVDNCLFMSREHWDEIHDNRKQFHFLCPFIDDVSDNQIRFNIGEFVAKYDREYIHDRIMIIDEPIIRESFLREYRRVFEASKKDEEIEELRKKLAELESEKLSK